MDSSNEGEKAMIDKLQAIEYQGLANMFEDSLNQDLEDLLDYWNKNYMARPYDCVIRGQLMGVKLEDAVLYNPVNNVILFKEDYDTILSEARAYAVEEYLADSGIDIYKWVEECARASEETLKDTDWEIDLDESAKAFGFLDFEDMRFAGSTDDEYLVYGYAYCLEHGESWMKSKYSQMFYLPLSNFTKMTFKSAIDNVKVYLYEAGRKEEYQDTPFATPEERMALALEKIADIMKGKIV